MENNLSKEDQVAVIKLLTEAAAKSATGQDMINDQLAGILMLLIGEYVAGTIPDVYQLLSVYSKIKLEHAFDVLRLTMATANNQVLDREKYLSSVN